MLRVSHPGSVRSGQHFRPSKPSNFQGPFRPTLGQLGAVTVQSLKHLRLRLSNFGRETGMIVQPLDSLTNGW